MIVSMAMVVMDRVTTDLSSMRRIRHIGKVVQVSDQFGMGFLVSRLFRFPGFGGGDNGIGYFLPGIHDAVRIEDVLDSMHQ